MRVSDEIMSNYQHVVDELTLRPGRAGVFDVDVLRGDDHTQIFSKQRAGRQAQPGEVLAALESLLPDGTLRYGT